MGTVIIVVVLLALALGAAFIRIFSKLAAPRRNYTLAGDWMRRLSADKYRPMQRLLDESDFAFLASHPAATRAMERRLRAARRRAFRGYLRSLERDFGRVCGAIQVLMVHSAVDRPDLAAILVKQRALFSYGSLSLQVRLTLDAVGYRGVSVQPLLASLEALSGELRQLVPATQPATA